MSFLVNDTYRSKKNDCIKINLCVYHVCMCECGYEVLTYSTFSTIAYDKCIKLFQTSSLE